MRKLYMVFDVESVGLHGEGYAVGIVVVNDLGALVEERCYACDPRAVRAGTDKDIQWVMDNAFDDLAITHTTATGVRNAFWKYWMGWKDEGVLLFADCQWPVEARFLHACVEGNLEERNWNGPYPLHDIATVLLCKGKDPTGTFPRFKDELPVHNPLCDARQSARILIEHLHPK